MHLQNLFQAPVLLKDLRLFPRNNGKGLAKSRLIGVRPLAFSDWMSWDGRLPGNILFKRFHIKFLPLPVGSVVESVFVSRVWTNPETQNKRQQKFACGRTSNIPLSLPIEFLFSRQRGFRIWLGASALGFLIVFYTQSTESMIPRSMGRLTGFTGCNESHLDHEDESLGS